MQSSCSHKPVKICSTVRVSGLLAKWSWEGTKKTLGEKNSDHSKGETETGKKEYRGDFCLLNICDFHIKLLKIVPVFLFSRKEVEN